MTFNYALCEVVSHFCEAQDQSMCRVSKPLQLFALREQADEALEVMNSFYDYELRVVAIADMHEKFR